MASRYQNFIKGIGLVPNATDANTTKGDLNVVAGDGKLNYHNGTSSSPIVTEVHASEGANRLQNKDLDDTTTSIVDSSDTTKKIKFDAAGTTGTSTTLLSSQTANQILTLPDATDTLVGKNTSDIFTNKTLDFDTGTTGNSISNVPDSALSSNVMLLDATQTITGIKSFDVNTFVLNGALFGSTEINAEGGASGIITVPSATDTLVARNTSDVLTNKTLDFDTITTGNVISNIPDSALTANVMLLDAIQTVTAAKSFDAGTLVLNGATSGTTILDASAIASGTLTFPAATDTLVARDTTDTLTNKTISGVNNTLSDILNSSLVNSDITVNGVTIALGDSDTITASTTNPLTIGTGLDGTSFDGSTPVTISIDSTVVTLTGNQILTNKTINGSDNTITNIANASLVNDDITVNGVSIALGASDTITANTTNDLTIGTGLTGTSFNGSSAVTIAIDSTVVTTSGSQNISDKTLVNPLIDDTLVSVATKDLKVNAATGKNVLLQNEGSTIATVASTGLTLASNKELTLTNNSQTVGIKSSATASASYTITLPAAAPTANTGLVYDGTDYIWGATGGGGGSAGWVSSSQTSKTNGSNLTVSATDPQQAIEVSGDGTTPIPVLSTTPFGSTVVPDKTVVKLFGVSNTNPLGISNSNVSKGAYLNGNAVLYLGYSIELMYIASLDRWVETNRNF